LLQFGRRDQSLSYFDGNLGQETPLLLRDAMEPSVNAAVRVPQAARHPPGPDGC